MNPDTSTPYHNYNQQEPMIRFFSDPGHVTFGVQGFEFPDCEDDAYDMNWLNVSLGYHISGKRKSIERPMLLTWELAKLFKEVACWNGRDTLVEFVEPELEFRLLDGCLHMTTRFGMRFGDNESEVYSKNISRGDDQRRLAERLKVAEFAKENDRRFEGDSMFPGM